MLHKMCNSLIPSNERNEGEKQKMSSNLRLLRIRRNNQHQSIRPRPEGPDRITCTIIEKATGRTLTSAIGPKTRKRSAAGHAKRAALERLKKKYGKRYNPDLHELKFKE